MRGRRVQMFTLLTLLSSSLLFFSYTLWFTSDGVSPARQNIKRTNITKSRPSQLTNRNKASAISSPCHHTSASNFSKRPSGQKTRGGNQSYCLELSDPFLSPALRRRQSEEYYIQSFRKVQNCIWTRRPEEHKNFRSKLASCCNAVHNFIVSQNNTLLGSNMSYEVDNKKNIFISEIVFKMFPKSQPFMENSYKRCAVVGNGGILQNSSCGAEIDESDFVFRCNLPPINGTFCKDVGKKTNVVTVNPSIILLKYGNLSEMKNAFLQNMASYGNAYLLLPAFSYISSTALSFKVFSILKESKANQKAIFFHPMYLKNLGKFWKTNGVRAYRLSTGFMITSAAIELCEEVTLYGFWPFTKTTEGNLISHHYYDNELPKAGFHAMPKEFIQVLKLHGKGILKVQVGNCGNNDYV